MNEPINSRQLLLQKIKNKTACIGIIGLGYVGLPLALRFLEAGFPVLGLDIDKRKTSMLMSGESYIGHISAAPIGRAVHEHRFEAVTDFSMARKADALILCVPTPLNSHREPDLSYVVGSLENILPYLRPGQLVSLESTTYPGTTDEELQPRIEQAGLVLGRDIFLVYSPEREDPGNPNFRTQSIPKICGGATQACLEVGMALYSQVIDHVIPASSTRTAEAVKLMENIFRSVNIALVNELKVAFMKMDIDIFEVIRAASTKPFGYMPFFPGPGLGGHCIPIDPFYLTWKAREYEVVTRFIELAGEINTAMPYFVVQRAADVLNEHGKAVKGSRILILGLAYKADVDDDRESPTYRIMSLLEQKGANVDYNDPHVPEIRPNREYPHYVGRRSSNISSHYDLIVLCTAHKQYREIDPAALNAPLLDTRGFFPDLPGRIYRG